MCWYFNSTVSYLSLYRHLTRLKLFFFETEHWNWLLLLMVYLQKMWLLMYLQSEITFFKSFLLKKNPFQQFKLLSEVKIWWSLSFFKIERNMKQTTCKWLYFIFLILLNYDQNNCTLVHLHSLRTITQNDIFYSLRNAACLNSS